jgi:hypothetical protein
MDLKEMGCVMDSSACGADPTSYPVVTRVFSPSWLKQLNKFGNLPPFSVKLETS